MTDCVCVLEREAITPWSICGVSPMRPGPMSLSVAVDIGSIIDDMCQGNLQPLVTELVEVVKRGQAELSRRSRDAGHTLISEAAIRMGLPKRDLYEELRLMLTGKTSGLDILDVLHVLTRDQIANRLERWLAVDLEEAIG